MSQPNSSVSQKYTSHPHDAILFGVGFSLDETMNVDALAPGCSADKSGSVQVGDYVHAVDGKPDLDPSQAKKAILGRQGTYATISFRRPEGPNIRTFKVQLMRGSADYIFLVECLRGLEHQIADLQSENDELRNKTSMPVEPSSNGATAEVWRKVSELQHENEWLKNKHRDEIQDLVTRMEEIENRERIMPQPVAMTYETDTMPMSEQSSVSSSNFKKERAKAQRSAPLPPSSQSSCMKEEGEEEELAIKFKPKQTRAQRSSGTRAQRSGPPPQQQSNPNVDLIPITTAYEPSKSRTVNTSEPSDSRMGSSPNRVPFHASEPRLRADPYASPQLMHR